MANPQKENGYTPIANELLEAILVYDFPSASPLKILLAVYRKCYGYSKSDDHLSLTQIEKLTNLSRPTVVHWLEWLVKSLLLVKGVLLPNIGYHYTINKDYDAWNKVVKPLLLVKPRRLVVKPPLLLGSKPPLTHINKYKTNIHKQGVLILPFQSDQFKKTWLEFKEMRFKIKKPLTHRAEEMILAKVEKETPETAIKILEQSIEHCWQTVYPLKDNGDLIAEDLKRQYAENPEKAQWDFMKRCQKDESLYAKYMHLVGLKLL